MDLLHALEERRSCRAFVDRSVERPLLERLLYYAGQAPSAINLQPWEFVVVSGEERKRLSRLLVKRLRERSISCGPGAKNPLPAFFGARQKRLLEQMLPALPSAEAFRDFFNEGSCDFYGAPTAIFVTLDQVFENIRLADIGITVGYLVLAAYGLGLGTCPIGLVTSFGDEIREELGLPEEKQIVISVAVGYPDAGAPINQSRSERAPFQELVRWRE